MFPYIHSIVYHGVNICFVKMVSVILTQFMSICIFTHPWTACFFPWTLEVLSVLFTFHWKHHVSVRKFRNDKTKAYLKCFHEHNQIIYIWNFKYPSFQIYHYFFPRQQNWGLASKGAVTHSLLKTTLTC